MLSPVLNGALTGHNCLQTTRTLSSMLGGTQNDYCYTIAHRGSEVFLRSIPAAKSPTNTAAIQHHKNQERAGILI